MRKPDEERPHPAGMGGTQRLWRFQNGYGASVVQTPFSYGADQGKWELAVVKFKGDGWKFNLVYDTPVTSDVEGYLTEEKVDSLLSKIEELPKRNLPYEWCHGSPTREECARRGYCNRDPNCGE